MASKYWIKLYHEMLYDRKVAALDDHLWRRVIEVFLMAGELDEGGYLPPLDDMAWTLRAHQEQLETDLNELTRVGILEFKDDRYFVRKFSTRQEPMPKAEYMRRKREQARTQEHYKSLPPRYQPVTRSNAVTNGNTDTDTDTDTEKKRREEEGGVGGAGFYIFSLVNFDYAEADNKTKAAISQLIDKYGEYKLCYMADRYVSEFPDIPLRSLLKKINDKAQDFVMPELGEEVAYY